MDNIKRDFDVKFNPREYAQDYMYPNFPKMDFIYECLHNIFDKDEVTGETLLDVGTGPGIYSCISASRKVKAITMSDLLEKNRAEIMKWKNRDVDAIDWTPTLKYIADLEKESDYIKLDNRLRAAFQKVIPIDITNPHPTGNPNHQFDIVTCNRVFESVVPDIEHYFEVYKNVQSLLKPKGLLIRFGALQGPGYYLVGGNRLTYLAVEKKTVEMALKQAGLQPIHWYITPPIKDGFYAGAQWSVVVARKVLSIPFPAKLQGLVSSEDPLEDHSEPQ